MGESSKIVYVGSSKIVIFNQNNYFFPLCFIIRRINSHFLWFQLSLAHCLHAFIQTALLTVITSSSSRLARLMQRHPPGEC